jgi:hypothetical protein
MYNLQELRASLQYIRALHANPWVASVLQFKAHVLSWGNVKVARGIERVQMNIEAYNQD